MDIIATLLGKNGVIVVFGILIFTLVYRNSINVFRWVEDQTYGTRDYILEKLEMMFIEVDPGKLTLGLLIISFGFGVFTLAIFGVFGLWLPGVLLGGLLGFAGWKLPKPLVHYMIEERIKDYQNQMVDALSLMANGIRAGLSLPQCLAMVVDELPAPVSQEFNLMLQQNRIGVSLDECFENFLKRMPTPDNEMFVTSVLILRETGGNLAETFDTIISVIRERIRVQQKIDTYVAQGKAQGTVIFLMPFALTGIFTASDPDNMMNAMVHPIGIFMFLASLILCLVGGWVILKIIKIKV